MVQTVSTYKLEGTLEAYGDKGWELVTTSIRESKKEGFEKIQLIFKKEKNNKKIFFYFLIGITVLLISSILGGTELKCKSFLYLFSTSFLFMNSE